MAWATDYRPRTLADVIGQEWPKQVIRGALERQKGARAWLLSGGWGCGKTTITRILAKAFACHNPSVRGEACQTCSSCKAIDADNSPNYTEVDAASRSGVEDIKRLIADVYQSPVGGSPYRTIALDEVHALSKAAQNALLKTLEEPSATTHLFLVTTDPEKLLNTIRSRCLNVILEPVERKTLVKHLAKICEAEKVEYEETALELIVVQKHGHVRDVLTLAETISLGGPLNLTNVKKNLHLDLDEHVVNVILHLGEDWDKTTDQVEFLTQDTPSHEIWNTVRRLLINAQLQRLTTAKSTDGAARLVDKFGARVSVASEWILEKGSGINVRTDADLIVAFSVLQSTMGVIVDSNALELKKKNLGQPKARKAQRHIVGKQQVFDPDDFVSGLGVGFTPAPEESK